MKYQENDSFVIFLSRPEQRPLRKVAAMDKSSKTRENCCGTGAAGRW
jgi:Cu(I)/Ag(I) efflux system outer membrane protein